MLGLGAQLAQPLLDSPSALVLLHGDLHHRNLLDSNRGWLAIDPKGVYGDPLYEYANWLCNPHEVALEPGRLESQLDWIGSLAGVERARLSRFVCAHACLAAAWSMDDGGGWEYWLAMASRAQEALS